MNAPQEKGTAFMAIATPELIAKQIGESISVKQAMLADDRLINQIAEVADLIVDTYRAGGKVLIAGNGGSAADAQHIAAELVSRFTMERPALPAIALTTDTSIITAISNDYGYDNLFSRQLEAMARPGDVFLAISTSGNSANVVRALEGAAALKLVSVGMTGATGGKLKAYCDHCLCVPSTDTARIQEGHITIGHILCETTEQGLFGNA
ncbi:D-sedoheptulose 7-phosphate isomerase [Thiosocius teredinicola]